jgi:hypothetical protein
LFISKPVPPSHRLWAGSHHEITRDRTNPVFIYAAGALFSFRDEKENTISGFCVDEGLVLNI